MNPRYRHFKGSLYEVVGIARHSESLEEHVIYSPTHDPSTLWIRPRREFEETIERNGKTIRRFEPVD